MHPYATFHEALGEAIEVLIECVVAYAVFRQEYEQLVLCAGHDPQYDEGPALAAVFASRAAIKRFDDAYENLSREIPPRENFPEFIAFLETLYPSEPPANEDQPEAK